MKYGHSQRSLEHILQKVHMHARMETNVNGESRQIKRNTWLSFYIAVEIMSLKS